MEQLSDQAGWIRSWFWMRIARDLSFLGRLLGSSSPKASKISNISRFFGLTRGGMSMIMGAFLVGALMAGLMTDLSLMGGLGLSLSLIGTLSLIGMGGGLIGGLIGMGLSLIGMGGLSRMGGLGGLSLMGRDLGLGSIGIGSPGEPAGKGPGPPFSPEEDEAP